MTSPSALPVEVLASERTPNSVFVASFFVTVASILGTGILGLPDDLYRCGFWPFMLLFGVGLFMQAAVVVLMVELLSFASMHLQQSRAASGRRKGFLPAKSDDDDDDDDVDRELVSGNSNVSYRSTDRHFLVSSERYSPPPASAGDPASDRSSSYEEVVLADNDAEALLTHSPHPAAVPPVVNGDAHDDGKESTPVKGLRSELEEHGPDWHGMAVLFLPPAGVAALNFFVMFHFLTILTSYAIAGPQSIGQMLHASQVALTVPYVLILTAVVVFGQRLLATVVSWMTFTKGSLLVVVVAITGIIAGKADEPYENDWRHTGDPFLLTTVALGGVLNVMPVYFQKVRFNAPDIRKFRMSVLLGLFAVWLLNVFWALFLLMVVPQEGHNSLHQAREDGKIATVPLTNIINADYPSWKWVSWMIRSFIAISVTVSFIALGSGMKHVLDGYVVALRERGWYRYAAMRVPTFMSGYASHTALEGLVQSSIYAASFGLILLIALANPSGFIDILENFTSLALNLQSGCFLAVMVWVARSRRTLNVPAFTGRFGLALMVATFTYFGVAAVFDVVQYVTKLVNGDA